MLVGILKKLVGIMIGPVGILKNACRYFETVGIMNVGIMNVGIMNATHLGSQSLQYGAVTLFCQNPEMKEYFAPETYWTSKYQNLPI